MFCCEKKTWAPVFLAYGSAHGICLLAHWLHYQRLTNCHTEWGCVSTCSDRERKPLCGQHEPCSHRMTHYTKLFMRPFKQLVQALVQVTDAFKKKRALEWHYSAATVTHIEDVIEVKPVKIYAVLFKITVNSQHIWQISQCVWQQIVLKTLAMSVWLKRIKRYASTLSGRNKSWV